MAKRAGGAVLLAGPLAVRLGLVLFCPADLVLLILVLKDARESSGLLGQIFRESVWLCCRGKLREPRWKAAWEEKGERKKEKHKGNKNKQKKATS